MIPALSIVTTCKGRLHHLKRSLPFMLEQQANAPYDVIVVDYGCPDGTFDWCSRNPDPRVKCVGVNANIDRFNLARARNIGAKFSVAPVLLFLDCDILADSVMVRDAMAAIADRPLAFASVHPHQLHGNAEFFLHSQHWGDMSPTPIARVYRRQLFESLRGVDEGFVDWGWEDVDLWNRAHLAGIQRYDFPTRPAFLNHGNEDSVRFYAEKDKMASAALNHKRMTSPRDINPHGWGIAGNDVRFHSQTAEWCNPNFRDMTANSDDAGRGDCQAGWHDLIGHTFCDKLILDVGSGLGRSKDRLAANLNSVSLFEPSKGFPTDFDCQLQDIPSRSFDVVTAFDVIEHVRDHHRFIAELRRIARSQVFLSTPNFNVSRCENWFHAREYTPPQLASLIGEFAEYFVSDNRNGYNARPVTESDFLASTSPCLGVLETL